ncbi:MAG TPA: hypothetical protein VM142_02370 [Acidimicrobiales bacterium]|nr:hypothetical protein [Acidimicrobiales bacterium]
MTENMTARKGLVFGTVVTATLVALVSTAFACGTWAGRFKVQGNASTNTSEATGAGIGGGMSHCSGSTYLTGAEISSISTLPVVGYFDAWTYSATCGTGAGAVDSTLPDGTYTINYLPSQVRTTAAFDDCMNGTEGGAPTGGVGVPLKTVTVGTTTDGQIDGQPVRVSPAPAQAQTETGAGISIVCISGAAVGTLGRNNQLQVKFV